MKRSLINNNRQKLEEEDIKLIDLYDSIMKNKDDNNIEWDQKLQLFGQQLRDGNFLKDKTAKAFLKYIDPISIADYLFEYYKKELSSLEKFLKIFKQTQEDGDLNFTDIARDFSKKYAIGSFVLVSFGWAKNPQDIGKLIYELMYNNKKRKKPELILALVLLMAYSYIYKNNEIFSLNIEKKSIKQIFGVLLNSFSIVW